MNIKFCYRCGKPLSAWHYVNGRAVCADDRMCYPAAKEEKKNAKAFKSSNDCSHGSPSRR